MRSVVWDGTLTAKSSIAHSGETRGTITLLRREAVVTEHGRLVQVPVVSGNTFRGRLRRIGEELLRDVLQYEGHVSAAAAHALRGGGSLAKTSGEPLSGNRLQRLRELLPQIGVFGAAAGGTIISGALDVGKVVPHLQETSRITGVPGGLSAFEATQLETYTRQDDSGLHDFVPVISAETSAWLEFDDTGTPAAVVKEGANQMLFRIETFPAGTCFTSWVRLRRPSPLELAFFVDILSVFSREGRLGGRVGIGMGEVEVALQPDQDISPGLDWRTEVAQRRDEALEMLGVLA